mgnify:CR=1 FL=1
MTQLFSLFLSSIILIGTMNLQFGVHYCNGEVQSVALFGEAEACAHKRMAERKAGCPFCKSIEKEKDAEGCCSDKEVLVEGVDIFDVQDSECVEFTSFNQFLLFFHVPKEEAYIFRYLKCFSWEGYAPPLIKREIVILVQSFLL